MNYSLKNKSQKKFNCTVAMPGDKSTIHLTFHAISLAELHVIDRNCQQFLNPLSELNQHVALPFQTCGLELASL